MFGGKDKEQRRLYWARWYYRHRQQQKKCARWEAWFFIVIGIGTLGLFGLGFFFLLMGLWLLDWSKKPIPEHFEMSARPRVTALEYLRAEEARLSELKKH